MSLVRDWVVFTFLRILHALDWPVWALVLIGLVAVPIAMVRTYCWWIKRALEASE